MVNNTLALNKRIVYNDSTRNLTCMLNNIVNKERGNGMDRLLMTADEIAKEMNISKSYAYKIIKRLNTELEEMGYYTVAGKVNRKYFLKKIDYDDGKGAG